MPAEPVDPWTGTFDATQDAVKCAQKWNFNNGTAHVIGVEDCLVLNVASSDLDGNAPIIVRTDYIIIIHKPAVLTTLIT